MLQTFYKRVMQRGKSKKTLPSKRVAKLRFTTRKQIRALAPHAKKLRFSTLANLSVKNPWRMSPDFSDYN